MRDVLKGRDDEVLAAVDGRTHAEAAAILGCNASSVSRALRAIGRKRSRALYALPEDNPALRQAHWSDYSWEGWERAEFEDSVEVEYRQKGEEEIEILHDIVDPGVQYPPGWSGPRLLEHRTFRVRPWDGVKRTFVTGVQDKTPLHGPFMCNLEADAAYLGAEILTIGVTYNKDWYKSVHGNDAERRKTMRPMAYSSYIANRVHTRRVDVADVQVCGEVNIIPTADRPLTGLLTYGKGRTSVFASSKQELESVPRAPHLDPVTCWTTGFATPPNYVQRKSGLKASFHHVIGAVLIEEDVDGKVFIRHIHADPETGAYQDLDRKVVNGVVSTGNRVQAINFGCVHREHLDPLVGQGTWFGPRPMQDALRPEHVFVHDVLDFYSRNHHNRADPWHLALMLREGRTVAQEIRTVGNFLSAIRRKGTTVHVVESNHDQALGRWVREADWRTDPLNAPIQLELAMTQAKAIAEGRDISLFEVATRNLAEGALDGVNFLREDQSFTLDGVEFGWHGHNGANGARGNTQNFILVACKISKAHDHRPTKRQGVASAGTKQRTNPMPRWAKGPTSWAHADVVHYDGGRSSHVFFIGDRWRAEGHRRTA